MEVEYTGWFMLKTQSLVRSIALSRFFELDRENVFVFSMGHCATLESYFFFFADRFPDSKVFGPASVGWNPKYLVKNKNISSYK